MLEPETILNEINFKPNMIVAEFGCGSGNLTIPLSEKVRQGKVYALDILEEKIDALKHKSKMENVFNIKSIICDLDEPEGSTLSSGSVDVVLMVNVLFQAEKKDVMIKEGIRILKEGGELLIVDWKEDSIVGPKEGKISAGKAKEVAEKARASLKKEFSLGEYHYGLTFIK